MRGRGGYTYKTATGKRDDSEGKVKGKGKGKGHVKKGKGKGKSHVKEEHLESKSRDGDEFLFASDETEKAVSEIRQQRKEGADKGKNQLMKRAKLRSAVPDDKGAIFKDRFSHFTPEQKLTEQVYLPFGGGKALEEHPRRCTNSLCNKEEVTRLHLEAEHCADVSVSFLRDLVAQSTVAKHYADDGQTFAFFNTIKMLKDELTSLGFVVRTPEFKNPLLSRHSKQPPFLLAQPKILDPRKPTVLVHVHYDSVSVAEQGWKHDPLHMGRKDGYLTGRGVSSKSAVAAWICALAAMKHTKIPSSVNIKFCIDPFGELGNAALDECLTRENTGFFTNISAVVVCQGQWMTNTQPNIVYGQRGVHNYYLNIKGGEKRLDAGKYGGLVREPLIELTQLISHLTNIEQTQWFPRQVKTKNINKDLQVADVCEEEKKMIDELHLCITDLQNMTGVEKLKTDDCTSAIQKTWREPAVSINSIKHGFEPEEEYQTTIPKHATARFSIRTVPNQKMDAVDILVKKYFTHLHRSMNSTNEMAIRRLSQYPWWLSSRDHWNYDTAQKAIKSVWKVKPEFTRDGGISPAAVLFEKHLRTNVLVLPIGKPSDEPRTVHENFDEVHYINAIKTFCSYMCYAGEMARSSDKFISSDNVKETKPKKKEKMKKSQLAALIPRKTELVDSTAKDSTADDSTAEDSTAEDSESVTRVKNPQMESTVFRHVSMKKRGWSL